MYNQLQKEINVSINIDDLTLDQIKQIQSMTSGNDKPSGGNLYKNGETAIVVLQRGWVAVGVWNQSGDMCELSECSVIRSWGTDKGLGQLALNGPTSKTRLDPCGVSTFHQLGVVMVMATDGDLWK